jgi:hypothetical protein
MLVRTISNEVERTVKLGGGVYAAHLVVSTSGSVRPGAYSATGVDASRADARLANRGTIVGGHGGYHGADGYGGIGVHFSDGGRLFNPGLIAGGAGGSISRDAGGIGVSLDGATASNSGTISGGKGGGYYGGSGGAAVLLQQSSFSNSGDVLGGFGGYGYARNGGAGGIGIILESGTIINGGTVAGGSGGYSIRSDGGISSGAGIDLAGTGLLKNHATISGGSDLNYGQNGAYTAGGDGVDIAKTATLINTGTIDGGNAQDSIVTYYGSAYAAHGGAGVDLALNGTLTSSGTIVGGAGGDAFGGSFAYGGKGGRGVDLASGGAATNTGTILAGNGGYGGRSDRPDSDGGGAGGFGVYIGPAATLFNRGTIIAGNGGGSDNTGGAGGAGVFLNGGTLTSTGTIKGGHGGAGSGADGANGDAVQFGTLAATLVVTASAVFNGRIVADKAVDDTLVLAGTAGGLLSGFGSAITGFTDIEEDAGAYWRLNGSISGTGALTLGSGARIFLDGAVSIASIVFAEGGHETLHLYPLDEFTSVISGFGVGDVVDLSSIKATSFKYSHGTLTLLGAGNTSLGTLSFAGTYSKADFALQKDARGSTEVVYAGAPGASAPPPDFLPQSAFALESGTPADVHMPGTQSGAAMPTATHLAMLNSWHAHPPDNAW